MKKELIMLTLLTLGSLSFSAKAQLTNVPTGSVAQPKVSTEDNPVWYNVMSSHLTALDRQNRFLTLKNNKDTITTEKFITGIPDSCQADKYLWRLEAGAHGDGYVYFINKASGKRLTGSVDMKISSERIQAKDTTGIEWKMATSASTGLSTQTTENQYCFNYEGGTTARYLNATDASAAYTAVVYNAGVHQASGWFFFEVNKQEPVAMESPENGTIALKATNGTKNPTIITGSEGVIIGTQITIEATPDNGYQLESLTVNGADSTAKVVSNKLSMTVRGTTIVGATFKPSTGLKQTQSTSGVVPTAFKDQLTVMDACPNTRISMFDMTGKEVLSSTQPVIATKKLAKGNYILKYKSAKGTKTVKVVKD